MLSVLTAVTHHLEGLGDDHSEHPDPNEDEERRAEADCRGHALRHPPLSPGGRPPTQNLENSFIQQQNYSHVRSEASR